ncbi:hypothetical protein ASG31_18095 [Chryseobacterium sp. Leaf404]|uniref:sensor histidine kinase n=1 Tax=unclassified Chryseobacterium TaxID=2593645 RepID=UPI0006F7B60D|nr:MULTISPECIES: histidine kinase [unclassified Chryseobacterium]KQT19026.1 hypothetical protein ASG31_18095 [Chryseobacterium sp. Leaf404]
MRNEAFERGPLLNKISNIDFNNLYTPFIRIFLHCIMWLFFTALLGFYYNIEVQLPFRESAVLTIRTTINNAVLFYLYFYFIFPIILTKERWGILLMILSAPLSLYIWSTTNHIQFLLLNLLEFDVKEGPFKGMIKQYAQRSYKDVISYKSILGSATIIIFSLSPPFFVKILFNITRLFSQAIYYQKQNLSLQLENVNIEKDFLKAQLNPHFLFNTLNNLYGLVIKKDPTAPDAIIMISEIMSYTLYESNTEKVSIEKEIEFIKNYFYLEKMRHSPEKEISLDISISDEKLSLQIAPLLTFALIENSFKYGLGNASENFIRIKIKIENNSFHFVLENNKNAYAPKDNKLGGIGIKNIKKRLELLYKDSYDLVITENDMNYYVSLTIDLQYDK